MKYSGFIFFMFWWVMLIEVVFPELNLFNFFDNPYAWICLIFVWWMLPAEMARLDHRNMELDIKMIVMRERFNGEMEETFKWEKAGTIPESSIPKGVITHSE